MDVTGKKINYSLTFTFFALAAWALYAITWDIRPFPIFAPVDDWKYAKDALSIASGHWLGPYSFETLTKRPLFPFVLAITHLIGIPFTVFLYTLHFAAAIMITRSFQALKFSRFFCATLFLIYLFMPMCFDLQASRVIRDFYFVSLQTLLLASVLYFISIPRGIETKFKRIRAFAWFCVLLAFHYGTREEYMLLWPGLGILFLYYLSKISAKNIQERMKYGFLLFGFAATAITTSGFIIRSLNYFNYGSFVIIEHEEGSFPKLIGHLASINEGPKDSKLLIDWEEREKLSQVLPRFRPYQVALSFPLYDQSPRCQVEGKCEPFDFSHQIYAFRGNLHVGGCPLNGRGAELFFRDLNHEIERICQEKQISCESPLRNGMLPKFQLSELPDLIHFLAKNTGDMILLRHRGMTRDFKTDDSIEIVEKFNELTRQPHYRISSTGELFGPAPASSNVLRSQILRREFLGQIYNILGPLLGVMALIVLIVRLFKWRQFGGWSFGIILMIALLSAITARILLISYISAVDNYMGSNYITPNYNLYLILCLVLIAEFIEKIKTQRYSPQMS